METTDTPAGVDYRQFLKPGDPDVALRPGTSGGVVPSTSSSVPVVQGTSQSTGSGVKHDAASRSLALGEKAFVGVSVFLRLWQFITPKLTSNS